MDAFDICRICLREINHEPIKMTRLILRFLEICLQLANVTKPYLQGNVKQNLCAPCFNKISEFQDFHEQCKDSDEFWKAQFDDFKEIPLEKQLTFEQTLLLPLAEDSNSIEADTTVSTSEEKPLAILSSEEKDQHNEYTQQASIEEDLRVNQGNKKTMLRTPSPKNEEDEEVTQMQSLNSIDLTNWPDESNDDVQIQILGHSECDDNTKDINEEIIEYEYQIEDTEKVEIEEIPTVDEHVNSVTFGVDYRSFAYEKLEAEISNESTIIQETIETKMEEPSESETNQNSFFMTTTIDENGKVKMSYKCQHCGKFLLIWKLLPLYNLYHNWKGYIQISCSFISFLIFTNWSNI